MSSSDPATKADLDELRSELGSELRSELASKADLAELRAELCDELRGELASKADLEHAVEQMRGEVKEIVGASQKQLSWEIAHSANAICEAVIDQVRSVDDHNRDLRGRVVRLEGRVDRLEALRDDD